MRAWCGLAVAFSVPFMMIACGLDDTAIIANSGGGGGGDGSAPSDGTIGGGEGGGTGGDSGGGDSGGAGGDSGSGGDSGTDGGNAPILVYANTATDIWSYDVVNKILTKLATISCSGHAADIAIDGTGHMYLNEANDAIYDIALDGTCSNRGVLDAFAGDVIKIAVRAAGAPVVVAVDPQNAKYLGIDPTVMVSAHIHSLVDPEFSDNPPFDIVCNGAGSCWTALAHNNCSSGSSSACLLSFPADGSSAAISRGAIDVLPNGLAYANGSLWAFGDDGRIYNVNVSGTPAATEVTPISIVNAAAEPASWSGAASSSNY